MGKNPLVQQEDSINKWILMVLVGLSFLIFVLASIFVDLGINLGPDIQFFMGLLGIIIIFFAIYNISGFLLAGNGEKKVGFFGKYKGVKKAHNSRLLDRGPKIVVIGGGTGLAVLLRGLKKFTSNITAIVTVADDGGSSGRIREDLGMLPPGDIRNCILALAEMEPTMEKLLQYRFPEGSLKGQNFGNLFIASMNGISNSFEEAITKMSEVLAVTGRVYPVSLDDITLYALLKNEKMVKGESNIPIRALEENSPVDRVFIKPRDAKGLDEAVQAINNADTVVLGPGSLYTSIIPNLLLDNISEALAKTLAKKIYISNIMTQPGETDNYGVLEHVEAIIRHCPNIGIDYVIANTQDIINHAHSKYQEEGASLIPITERDKVALKSKNIAIVEDKLVEIKKDYVRHDAIKLSKIIIGLASKRDDLLK